MLNALARCCYNGRAFACVCCPFRALSGIYTVSSALEDIRSAYFDQPRGNGGLMSFLRTRQVEAQLVRSRNVGGS